MDTGHYIAVFGGAVAGSEAVGELTKNGIRTVVFDQHALPYGKLESGLPKWHYKMRNMQEKKINEKLNHPLVRFVPNIKLGEDITFSEIVAEFPFTAVLLATGAWRDRPLPIKDIDQYEGRGLIYMNALVSWFNQNHIENSNGNNIHLKDGAMIIGGGLASIDIIKIMVIETTRKALSERGIQVNSLVLEHKGIPEVLKSYGLTYKDLGLQGIRLMTRHTVESMPLTPIPENATPDVLEKSREIRKKIITKVQEKFPFEIVTRVSPVDKIVKDGQLGGIIFEKTEEVNSKFVNIPGSAMNVEASQVISAIGSIPEMITGIPLKGEIYDVENIQAGKIRGFENVFALGNAVTGRGNIRQSQMHSRQVSENIVDQYLVWKEDDYREIFNAAENRATTRVNSILEVLKAHSKLNEAQIKMIDDRVSSLQKKVGYDGNYSNWIENHLPPRLEEMDI